MGKQAKKLDNCMFCHAIATGDVKGFPVCDRHLDAIENGKKRIQAKPEKQGLPVAAGAKVLNTQAKSKADLDSESLVGGLTILHPAKRVDDKIAVSSEKVASEASVNELKPA